MKLASHSIEFEATREKVWHALLDWERWPAWDPAMESVHFDGPVVVGARGKLKFKNGSQVVLLIDAMNEFEFYDDHFNLFGTKLTFRHVISDVLPHSVRIDFAVDADGPTALLVGAMLAGKMKRLLPQALENLKALLSA